jgi:hypothetical protein
MRHCLLLIAFAGLTTACTTESPPDRLLFGVSSDRATAETGDESDAKIRASLDWKLNQICTAGYDMVKVDTLPAEEDRQFVNEDVRCKPYRLHLF